MKIARTHSAKIIGDVAVPVTVECSVEPGIGIVLVGLADAAVKESLLRTVTALQSNGYSIPGNKVIVNLVPVDLAKEGSAYDLPIALALIRASGQDDLSEAMAEVGGTRSLLFLNDMKAVLKDIDNWLIMGELGLDGSVRSVRGCVQAAETAINKGYAGVIVPKDNANEMRDLFQKEDIPIHGVSSLREAFFCIANPDDAPTIWDVAAKPVEPKKDSSSWDLLGGCPSARRALEIAAAGGHHLLLAGAPGSGKAFLAKAILDILPPMDREETLEVARVWSASGKGAYRPGLRDEGPSRPYRAPHYSIGLSALVGGGAGEAVLPGEVSLATGGVLHLDEFAEMPKSTKEALRGPLEDKKVIISRLHSKTEYPSRFLLVAGTYLCPCGCYGEDDRCKCTPSQRGAYLASLYGPVYDQIDIQVFVRNVFSEETKPLPMGEDVASVRKRVAAARLMQRKRLGKGRLNADMTASQADTNCRLGREENELMEKVISSLGLSVRSYTHILKVARTIADLEGSKTILKHHIAEAAGYRFLDRTIF